MAEHSLVGCESLLFISVLFKNSLPILSSNLARTKYIYITLRLLGFGRCHGNMDDLKEAKNCEFSWFAQNLMGCSLSV